MIFLLDFAVTPLLSDTEFLKEDLLPFQIPKSRPLAAASSLIIGTRLAFCDLDFDRPL